MAESKIVETWLSAKPKASAFNVALFSTLTLLLIHVLVWDHGIGLYEHLVASGDLVFGSQREWGRVFSAALIHADFGHLLSNGLLFFILSYYLSGYFGWALFPGLALVFGGIINFTVLWNYPPEVRLLGASGVVYWMGGVWLSLYVALDRRRSLSQRLIRALGVGLLLFLPSEAFDPKVSYLAHAVGFAYGVLTGALYFVWRKAEFRRAERVECDLSQNEITLHSCQNY